MRHLTTSPTYRQLTVDADDSEREQGQAVDGKLTIGRRPVLVTNERATKIVELGAAVRIRVVETEVGDDGEPLDAASAVDVPAGDGTVDTAALRTGGKPGETATTTSTGDAGQTKGK